MRKRAGACISQTPERIFENAGKRTGVWKSKTLLLVFLFLLLLLFLLLGLEQVAQIRPRIAPANRAVARRIDRPLVALVLGIF